MHLQFIPLYLLPSMHVCIHSFIVGSICIKLQTLFFMHQFNTGKLPKIFDSFFVKTSCKHNVNTRFASRSTFYLPKIRKKKLLPKSSWYPRVSVVRIVWSSGWGKLWKELLLVTDVSTTWAEVIFRVKGAWLPLRLSKRQSPTTVLFTTTLTRTITLYEQPMN